jgi:NAD(P)-dependent dehydrogenase (short-subunit alcohol dehydrogenase family)
MCCAASNRYSLSSGSAGKCELLLMRRGTAIAVTILGGWLASRAWRSRFSFGGKVVVISGGSRGLGLILARQISNKGGKVALLARDADELERAKAELTTRGGEVLTVQCDLFEPSGRASARQYFCHNRRARRAGRKILAAARRGQPSLTLTFAARGAILANVFFPNLTGYAMKIGNRFLPRPGSQPNANHVSAGHQVRRITPEWMTQLADRASAKNNERK